MRYRFSLGRGEAAMVLGGAALVGVLLFCTGLMTGLAVAPDGPAPPADAVMAAAPHPEAPDDALAPEEAGPAEAEGPVEAGAVDSIPDAGAGGVGGPAGTEPAPAVTAADGWSLPEGYDPPRGSGTRWTQLPPLGGAPEPAHGADGSRFGAYDGGGAPYALEVARFRDEDAAVKVMDELRARGHEVHIYTVVEGGSPVFRVRVNRYIDRQAAMRAAERLEAREGLAALVVPTEPR